MNWKSTRTVDSCKYEDEFGNICGNVFEVTSGNRRYCDEHSNWHKKEGRFHVVSLLADKYNRQMDDSIPVITRPKIIAVRGRYEPSEREKPFVEWREEL